MGKRTYISQDELDRILAYLKLNEIWNYYLIIYNLVISQKSYLELKGSDLIIPEGIPVPKKNPLDFTIRAVNKQLKIYNGKVGIWDVVLTTKTFSRRFTVKGEIFYGVLEKHKNSYNKNDEGYVYIVKHSHRNPEISKLLTDKKIGISYDYTKRVNSLTLGTIGVEVVKSWKMSRHMTQILEKILHKELIKYNLIGEWFSDDDGELVNKVEKLVMSYTPTPQ
jgi:hypothetical protein